MMEKYITDERTGLKYELVGDYYLVVGDDEPEEDQPIGVWGQRHLRHLKRHHKVIYANLLTSGKLPEYLADIDRRAEELFLRLAKQMAEAEGITEKLKASDQMEWVGRMNNVRNTAMELVRSIIDDPKNEENENKLRNLGCKQVDTSEIVRILCERAHLHIEDDKYRTALYRYLAETPELRPYSQQLRSAKIIPIKGKYSPQEISYVSFNEMSIFVDETAAVSTPEYGILNTKILPKNTLERILGVDIVVIDSRYKKFLYDDKLEGILTSTATNAEKYRQLISELKCSRSQFNASLGVLLQNKNRVPLLTEDGEYHTEDVFITTLESGYFYGKLLNSHIASKEAMELAKLIGCRDISLVSYEDLGIRTQITADDIEDLQMPDIRYGYHILEQCIFEGFISEELIEKYGLSGIKRTDYTGVFDESDFPNEPVKNHNNLRSQIQSQSRSAREIIKVQELRTVDKVRLPNGKEQSVNSSEIRENTIKRYRPASNTDGCFCQMCRTVKSTEYIEVNNIWAQPKYYWPQMRIALCLDCSKRFEAMRSNKEIIEQFYRSVKSANVHTSEPITIPIGNADIRFTQTHLAEIQAILQTNKQ